MSLVSRAILIATEAHSGQLDKAGVPYIYHPLRVMLGVQHLGEEYACCGVLHDVVEDTHVTLPDLKRSGFPDSVVAAVDSITKRESETNRQYIERCSENEIALACKFVDIKDNMSRLANLEESERHYLVKKYAKNIAMLRTKIVKEE